MKLSALLLALGLLLSGCTSLQIQMDPSADLSHVKTVFVEHRLADDHHLDELITAELNTLGIQATSGPLTMQPDRVDAIISYTDRWEWDFKSYLIDLNLSVRDGRTDKLLAEVGYYRPSVASKTPQSMLHEMLPPLFKARNGHHKPAPGPVSDPGSPDNVSDKRSRGAH